MKQIKSLKEGSWLWQNGTKCMKHDALDYIFRQCWPLKSTFSQHSPPSFLHVIRSDAIHPFRAEMPRATRSTNTVSLRWVDQGPRIVVYKSFPVQPQLSPRKRAPHNGFSLWILKFMKKVIPRNSCLGLRVMLWNRTTRIYWERLKQIPMWLAPSWTLPSNNTKTPNSVFHLDLLQLGWFDFWIHLCSKSWKNLGLWSLWNVPPSKPKASTRTFPGPQSKGPCFPTTNLPRYVWGGIHAQAHGHASQGTHRRLHQTQQEEFG